MLDVTKSQETVHFLKLSIDETQKSNQEKDAAALTFIGELPEFAPEQHPMKGSVFFNPANESQIIVRDFYYPQVTYFILKCIQFFQFVMSLAWP